MLTGHNHIKPVALAMLALYCLAFFRYDTTEKSMIRAVILEQGAEGWTAGLLYQAPEASADSSEAAAEIRFAASEGETLEKALDSVQAALPHTASYRLCDYVLLAPGSGWSALEEYEELVLRRQCGRTSAAVSACSFSCEELSELTEEDEDVLSDILQCVKDTEAVSPYLYELHTQPALVLPLETLEEGQPALADTGYFLTRDARAEIAEDMLQAYYLLAGKGGTRSFWLGGSQVNIRRCTVSVTACAGGTFRLWLDCQSAFTDQPPGSTQQQELNGLCVQTVQTLWAQGLDVLSLSAYAVQRAGPSARFTPDQAACPPVEAEVRFSALF